MAVLYHDVHLADQAAMRAARAVSAKPVLGPDSRPGFDAMISSTPAAEGVAFEGSEAGGVCDAHVWNGIAHVLPFNPLLHAAGAALDDIGVFLCDRLREGAAS